MYDPEGESYLILFTGILLSSLYIFIYLYKNVRVRQAAAGGAACCLRLLALDFLDQVHDRVPHHLTTLIHVPVGVANNLCI